MIKLMYYSNRCGLFVSLIIILLATACSEPVAPPVELIKDTVDVSIVLYEEQEAGTDTYPVRILVSPDFVRFDDGYDESDFVLLDRRTHTLFSVVHENQSVLEIKNQPYTGSLPADLKMTEEHSLDEDAPAIAGKQPMRTEYLANGVTCYRAISVPGLMDKAVAGMVEYATALGERQLANMQSIPDVMQTPCFMSRYAYAPGRHYSHGLPLQIWDESGYSSSLTDFQESETVTPDLFMVPDNYKRQQMGQ